jgi:hypothetical protein
MRRMGLTLLWVIAASIASQAHFVFVVPEGGSSSARVLLSETLQSDAEVDVGLIAGTKLFLRDDKGKETPLTLVKGDHAFTVLLAPNRRGVVRGIADLGVTKTGSKPNLLLYYPKTIVGDAFDARTRLGDSVPVEIIPGGSPGAVRLQLVARGKPHSGQITVILPDGSQQMADTDDEGWTEVFSQRGRYGAWARYWETTPGQRGGESYAEVRHYATLVFDAGTPASGSTVQSTSGTAATRVATLPEGTSSFGAAASDGWLYVYGGHVVPTHSYSTEAVSGKFNRLRLADGKTWERLPDGPPLQGLNLAAHGGKIYRVGGMQPQNKPGEPQDIRSIADVARFDPATGKWEALPSLPVPRSSHDVVVVGNTLVVVGGWTLKGKEKTEWPDSIELLDLSAPSLAWKRAPQPFKRRALIAAAIDGKVHVLGGFNERSQVVHGSTVFDVARGTWSDGPELPGGSMNGFGPAAAVVASTLYVSVDDGGLYRLDPTARTWTKVGQSTPRIVHRLIADSGRILVIGGAFAGKNSDLVEAVRID